MSQQRLGIIYSLCAYLLWGLMPLYLKEMADVPSLQVLSHRIVWSCLLLMGLLGVRWKFGFLRLIVSDRRLVPAFVFGAMSLSTNWFVYIFAVTSNRVVEASLGYFISPLVSVLLGVLVLRERLRRAQWLAIALSAVGVGWLTALAGQPPWIGLLLAASFGGYGLMRKTARLDTLEGLWLETALMLPIAVTYLAIEAHQGTSAWQGATGTGRLLLMAAGPVTAIPLLFFAAGARRIPLSLVGLLQYCSPTMQFLLGVFLFQEPFRPLKLVGYTLVWLSLLVYSVEGLWFSISRLAAGAKGDDGRGLS